MHESQVRFVDSEDVETRRLSHEFVIEASVSRFPCRYLDLLKTAAQSRDMYQLLHHSQYAV